MADEVDLYGDLYNDAELPAIEPPTPAPPAPVPAWEEQDQKPNISNISNYDSNYAQPQQQQYHQPPPMPQGGNAGGNYGGHVIGNLGGTTLNVKPSDMPEEGYVNPFVFDRVL